MEAPKVIWAAPEVGSDWDEAGVWDKAEDKMGPEAKYIRADAPEIAEMVNALKACVVLIEADIGHMPASNAARTALTTLEALTNG